MRKFFILIFSLIHIHVFMLCSNFELIPIKIGFFMNFLKLLQNLAKDPVLYVQYTLENLIKIGGDFLAVFGKIHGL